MTNRREEEPEKEQPKNKQPKNKQPGNKHPENEQPENDQHTENEQLPKNEQQPKNEQHTENEQHTGNDQQPGREQLPDVKVRILLAAKQLFAQHGYDGTTTRQICELAQANVALVNYHFGGKENVFYAVFDTFFPKPQFPAPGPDTKPIAAIIELIREVTSFRFEDPEMLTILHQEIVTQSPRIQKIQRYALESWKNVRTILALGREQGYFHFRSLDQTFLIVMGALIFPKNNCFVGSILTEGPRQTDDIVNDTVDFVLRGLGLPDSLHTNTNGRG